MGELIPLDERPQDGAGRYVVEEVACEIFNTPAAQGIIDSDLRHVISYLEARQEIPPYLRKRLQYYPQLLGCLIESFVLPASEATRLMANPTTCCSVVINMYDKLARAYESQLYGHLPSIERILVDTRFASRTTLLPDSKYVEMLKSEPSRYLRMLIAPQDVKESTRQQLARQAETLRNTSAAWAYFYLESHEGVELDGDLFEALARDQEYGFRTARMLKARGHPQSEWMPLVDQIIHPKWIYHCLRDEVHGDENHKRRLIMAIHRNPIWLGQWWSIQNMTHDELSESLNEFTARAKTIEEHPCTIELMFLFKATWKRIDTQAELAAKRKA